MNKIPTNAAVIEDILRFIANSEAQTSQLEYMSMRLSYGDLKALLAERKRLREALEKLAKGNRSPGVLEIAKQALGSGDATSPRSLSPS